MLHVLPLNTPTPTPFPSCPYTHPPTGFLDNHPGGKEILLLAAGRDITYAFDSYHPFTDKPQQGACVRPCEALLPRSVDGCCIFVARAPSNHTNPTQPNNSV